MKNYRILLVANSLFFGAVGVMMPLLSLYLQDLGADLALISIILTSAVVVALAGNFFWGWLADRTGRRKSFYIAGLLGMAVGYLWLSQANTIAMAWPARLLDGLGMAAVYTLGLTLAGDTLDTSSSKGRSIGLFRGLGSLAWAVGAFTGGHLADLFSVSAAFILCSVLMVAAALIALLLADVKPPVNSPAQSPTQLPAGTDAAVAQPSLAQPKAGRLAGLPLFYLAGVMLWTAVDYASSTMWPNYMASVGYSKTAISSLWSLAAFFEMPALIIFGGLSDVVGRTIMLIAGGFGIAAVQVGYVLFVQSLPILLGIQVARGLGLGSYTSAAMTFAAESGTQETRGSSSGVFYATSSAGQLAGTLLAGTMAQAFGFTALYLTCAVLATASGICFLALRHRRSRARNVPGTSQVPGT
jgi:MFS family permease